MTKTDIIEELKKLKKILDMDASEYAAMLNEKHDYKLEEHDTYPYRCGVAASMIEHILEP